MPLGLPIVCPSESDICTQSLIFYGHASEKGFRSSKPWCHSFEEECTRKQHGTPYGSRNHQRPAWDGEPHIEQSKMIDLALGAKDNEFPSDRESCDAASYCNQIRDKIHASLPSNSPKKKKKKKEKKRGNAPIIMFRDQEFAADWRDSRKIQEN